MEACFRALGKVQEERDKFIMAVFGKTKKSINRFNARQQDLFGEDEINLRTSSVVSWRKSTRRRDDSAIGKGIWGWMGGRPASSAESRLERMPDTLSKKLASSVAAAASESRFGTDRVVCVPIKELTREKSFLLSLQQSATFVET